MERSGMDQLSNRDVEVHRGCCCSCGPDPWMVCRNALLRGAEERFIQFLAAAQTREADLEVALAQVELRGVVVNEIHDPHRFAHVEDERLSELRHACGLAPEAHDRF